MPNIETIDPVVAVPTQPCQRYDALIWWLRKEGITPKIGAEIGVRHGETSEALCLAFPELMLHLVDPYTPYQDVYEYFDEDTQKDIKSDMKIKLKKAGVYDRCRLECKPSLTAAKHAIDWLEELYDFVFIDASHIYETVKADLLAWYPLVRAGGAITGHDFYMDGVGVAVREFADVMGLDIDHIDNPADVWCIQV